MFANLKRLRRKGLLLAAMLTLVGLATTPPARAYCQPLPCPLDMHWDSWQCGLPARSSHGRLKVGFSHGRV